MAREVRTDWAKAGNLQETCENSVKEGASDPAIIVMPDAEMTFYMNNAHGDYQYEDYFIKELIPYVENSFRCRTDKKFRSIAGLSMGGYGCLLYAFHHPELFASCGAMSAAVRTDEEIEKMPLVDFNRRYKSAMGVMKEGETRITGFWNQNSILFLVKKMPEAQKKSVRFYLDCGDDDEILYRGNAILHIEMRDANIPHEFRMRDGGHNWEYWKSGLPDILKFISKGIREERK